MIIFYTIFFSLLMSGFFSGMEIAFVTSNRLRIELDLKKRTFSSRLLNVFFQNPSRFIGALLLGNNISLVIYGIAMASALEPWLRDMLPVFLVTDIYILLIQTLISTLLILIVAEFLPKIFFRINPNAMLSAFAFPAWVLYGLLYPLILLYMGISELILRKVLRMKLNQSEYTFSSIDLNEYIQEFAQDEDQHEDLSSDIQLFQNAIEFRHVRLRDCMIPRTDIEALRENSSMDELLKKFAETKHSKILIFRENIDNIIGYVHSFDMFKKPREISEVLRTVRVYPETYPANTLLKMFFQTRQGIAVVVDEFGGTSGIVSMEDIIEEIFGEIDDEFDEEVTIEKELGNGEFIFSARLEIDYLNEAYRLGIPESDDYETLAGFILHFHESIPQLHEEIFIEPFRIKVLKAIENRLDEVQFMKEQ
ncbi:MAG: hemolysin family protein [Bacteroidales bacterium]|nr:hemolysin family protein [Bacteroidales bacterium]